MSQKYRMKSLAGPFRPGEIVTEEQARAAGGDLEFWKSHGAAVEVTDEEAAADEAPWNDEGLKAEIERRLREASVKRSSPLPPDEQARIASDVVTENKRRISNRESSVANPARRSAVARPAPPPAASVPPK